MNLRTTYLGLPLRNPLVASAGPLSQTVDGIRRLADGGVGAVVLYSVFEEQIRRQAEIDEALEEQHADAFGEALSYFPELPGTDGGDLPADYLRLLEEGAQATGVPIIGSINGSTRGGWTQYARQLQDAGAAAIELNIYFVVGDLSLSGREVEERHLDIVRAVKQAVSIPVAVKLSPYFSSVGNMCRQLAEAGADGLVLFNRFLQPEIDIDALDVEPEVELSSQYEGRLPRTWIAALRGGRVGCSLAATSGVRDADDLVRYLLAGADVVMTTSALVRNGTEYGRQLLNGLEDWMAAKGYESLDDFRGLLAVRHDDENAYQRAGYITALQKAKSTYGSF
ncbi:dihydroorotate dehydrogenase-like protein [Raineyella sp. W15-4]|uniref:dihydroorotate dehydrogenase-like protein n=1 Tax=Raineyella sp. W15-4 TaxID=3081651 RepID=UPI00295390CF|nr:dihydroorotate dehydrogenase-like protein [Raineyella sp. W15-4]WOQ16629.1 dihydroorotate dehydrogenase-like protein [Raineyella sp. W15-4]